MQSKNNMKRKGFTLVELLIVIVVIGILSAMMMLSSTEAVSSAKASNIVSNLRNLKTAALALYVDSLDKWEDSANTTGPTIGNVKGYLNNGAGSDYSNYYIAFDKNTGAFSERKWYIVYNIGSGSDATRIKQKLYGRAKSTGLKGTTEVTADGATITAADFEESSASVCTEVR